MSSHYGSGPVISPKFRAVKMSYKELSLTPRQAGWDN